MTTWRVLDLIQSSTDYLRKKGVPDPRLDAEYLLGHILDKKRLDLYMVFDQPLRENELDEYRKFIKRRGQREPLQHILGFTEFMGYRIETGPEALIPRPETEMLVELAEIELPDAANILDVGTGTGCIAIALACRNESAQFQALDVSSDALELARRNAEQHSVHERIQFTETDILAALPEGHGPFDVVVSNPPYIGLADREDLQSEVREYDPGLALFAAEEGLEFYQRFSVILPGLLKPGGRFVFEFGGSHQQDALLDLFQEPNYVDVEVHNDYSQTPRLISGRHLRA